MTMTFSLSYINSVDQPLDIEEQLLGITRKLLIDIEHQRSLHAVSLTADLQRELGIGSLEKAELINRIELNFAIHLPESLLTEAETLHDFVKPIATAHPFIAPSSSLRESHLSASKIDSSKASTLVEILQSYAENESDRPHIYLQHDRGPEEIITFAELYREASVIAQNLLTNGLTVQQTVAIMLPTSRDFFVAFFGVLLAGGIPVPIYPPFRTNQIQEYIEHEAKILCNANAHTLITFAAVKRLTHVLQNYVPPLKHILTLADLTKPTKTLPLPTIHNQHLALIQYTSGSTGDPKGVELTHSNLLNNIRAIGEAINIQPNDIVVSWLPLYHDMGLIGTWLGSLYFGIPAIILSPISFLAHPEKWLWTIHYHRATISAAPNFAYELCLSKIDERKLEGLDLSSWRLAFNGAEAIYAKTLTKFSKKFSKYGLRDAAIYPVYGLAENSVGLTFPTLNQPPRIDRVERDTLDELGIAKLAGEQDKKVHEFVSCGKPIPNHRIRIVDDSDHELPERHVGHLQFQGPSAMQGYHQNLAATHQAYHDGWWATGDYAYCADGDLFITGREKDLIIKAGRNLYPQEIEEIVEHISGIRKGRVIAFGSQDQRTGTEKLIIVAESHEHAKEQQQRLQALIVERVASILGLPPDEVIIASPDTITKTSSGKLQRNACKKAYESGKLLHHHRAPIYLQLGKLTIMRGLKKLLNGIGQLGKFFYTLYLVSLCILLWFPITLIILALPLRIAFHLYKHWWRLFFVAIGCPIKIIGKEKLSSKQKMIFTPNHASYMDTVLLIAVLPAGISFVGKKELLKSPLRLIIKRFGYLTVDRLDFANSLQDMRNIQDILDKNRSVLIFPEGTFTATKGLLPFKLGAFKLAVETNTPLCPIALRGTRTFLSADKLLFRPTRLTVWVGDAITPENDEFSEAIRLRNTIRQIISEHCGEKTLHLIHAGP
ncbi:MAG: AMP-binding protein [Pseudomonadota bacterium]|nr:AMP-binding protein [Pseudomonadota bacterium]